MLKLQVTSKKEKYFTHLYAEMTAQKKVEFNRMGDAFVHRCTRRHIACLANSITWIIAKESGMMAFLNDYHRDSWFIAFT